MQDRLKYTAMNALEEKITRAIADKGPITFETFMAMALYEPDLGYYMSLHTEIGRHGDYYTSPHLHPIFGAMLGRQIIEMWQAMEMPDVFSIIEIGAGRGYLAKDMLGYLMHKEIFNKLTYVIVELNPFIKAKQQALLSDFTCMVQWRASLKDLAPLAGCVLSNELLDAFPVHLIEMDDELKEIYVGVTDPLAAGAKSPFQELKGKVSNPQIYDYLKDFSIGLPRGYRTEINLRMKEWLNDVERVLKEGFVITVDYGYPSQDYYAPERTKGTLLCYQGHEFNEDPYQDIGQKDITSHVNFSALKKWGEDLGLKTLGFCQQGTYLVSSGIDELITELYSKSPDYSFQVAKMKGLFLPGTMGETHKVMVQYKGRGMPILKGFSLRNQIKNL